MPALTIPKNLFGSNYTILVAVSGGIDSVALCDLFHKNKIQFAIAHCNFKLRGKESNQDAEFVEQMAEKYNVPFQYIEFDTKTIAKQNKESIQVAARNLRYKWFEEIRKEFNYDFIATAHHQNDSIETFFINLLRGAGIKGLKGISEENGKIIRPLLSATKEDIIAYAKKNKLKHREDSSNLSDKYLRNKIRLKLIPLLKQINPAFEEVVAKNLHHLSEVEKIYSSEIEKKRKQIVITEKEQIVISIKKLLSQESAQTYLFEFLKPFGYSSSIANKIYHQFNNESGKLFFSNTHELLIDRKNLIIRKKKKNAKNKTFTITSQTKKLKNGELDLVFTSINYTKDFPKKNTIAAIDYEKLKFPLVIRKWEEGDYFFPLGMNGKKKKLSDFFIDNKWSLFEKENCWLLTSNNKIVWIIGHRMDERYKVTDKTKNIYFVELK